MRAQFNHNQLDNMITWLLSMQGELKNAKFNGGRVCEDYMAEKMTQIKETMEAGK